LDLVQLVFQEQEMATKEWVHGSIVLSGWIGEVPRCRLAI